MKRLTHHLLTLCSALSLLLCMALGVLWARSYNVGYTLTRWELDPATQDACGRTIMLGTGRVVLESTQWSGTDGPYGPSDQHWRVVRDSYWYATRSTMGVGVWHTASFPTGGMTSFGPAGLHVIGINLLVPIVLTAALPIAWRIRYFRNRRRRRLSHDFHFARCEKCGYDLRASPERCPECGKVPTKRIA